MRLGSSIVAFAIAGAVLLPAGPAAAVPYVLKEGGAFEVGCFDPCDCAMWSAEIASGSFDLDFDHTDPLFDHYVVSNVAWTIPYDDRALPVAGAGHYRIGGEVALTHQLTLDLSVDGGPLQHFDSGLVAGGAKWPEIDIAVAVHGFYCFDSAFVIRAVPTTAGVGGPPARPGIRAVRPNPFRELTVVDFGLAGPGHADLRIYDPLGREVRVLLSRWLEAGSHRASWDGGAGDGRPVPPGLYFLRLDAGGRSETVRIARVR